MLVDAYIRWVLKWPKSILVASVTATMLLVAGLPGLGLTNDMRAYFSDDNPQLTAFNALEDIYDKQDNVYLFVVADSGDIFDKQTLTLIWELTELGWQVPYARRASSIANYQHSYASADALVVEPLILDPDSLTSKRIGELKEICYADHILCGRLVASDGSAAGVLVDLSLPDHDLQANDKVTEWLNQALAQLRARYPQVVIHISGTTATNVALGEAVARDMRTLVALSYVTIFAGLFVFLRHIGATLVTIAVVSLSVAATMGIFGWLGATLSAIAGFVPTVVMTIAVADSVHILVTYFYALRRDISTEEAVRETLRINAAPVFITSVTTVIGVLTLNFSDSPPYRDLGNMVAVGVLLAYLLSMTFLPAVLCCAKLRRPAHSDRQEQFMNAFADSVIRHYRRLLWTFGALIIAIACFIPRNALTERWHEYFDHSFAVRHAVDAVSDKLGVLHKIRYSVTANAEHGIHEPAFLRTVENFSRWYESQPGVVYVERLPETIKRLNQSLHANDPAYRVLPESRELAAQLLLLYELSLPQGLGLENIVSVDRSATQVTAFIARTDSEQLLELDHRAQAWMAKQGTQFTLSEGTGVDMMFAHINHRNIRSLLNGMVLALVLISGLLIVALGSVKLGLLSLITNLAPAALAYGVWGLFVGRIDLSASVVMCMSIGIVVDDTVHFLSKYLRARREQGLDAAQGMRYAFNTVGVALCITTAVLVAGFLILGASHFNPSVTTGMLMATTLSFALLVDFLFMPPLLLELDKRWQMRF